MTEFSMVHITFKAYIAAMADWNGKEIWMGSSLWSLVTMF